MKQTKLIALVLALALLCTLLPAAAVAAGTEAEAEKTRSDAMAELARQLQDPTRDPFAFQSLPVQRGGLLRAGPGLPESFDLRHVDTDGDGVEDACYVTPVKFQNPFGNCWGFAAIASAETSILSSGLAARDHLVYAVTADTEEGWLALDLSEKHLAYFLNQPVDDPENPQYGEGFVYRGEEGNWAYYFSGGLPFYATGLLASGTGPVPEFAYVLEGDVEVQPFVYRGKNGTVTYSDGGPAYYSSQDDWSIDSSYRWFQNYVLKESYLLPTPAGKEGAEKTAAINAIKEQIYAGRAVQTGFCADNSMPDDETTKTAFISSNWAHYTYKDDTGANHAVTIIGWDDNYPRENFAHKTREGEDAPLPEENGAWLVKNSWGSQEEEFPNKGFPSSPWGLKQGQDRGVYNEATGKWEYNAIPGALGTGYFWLSYEDKSMVLLEALDFDAANPEEGYYLYQHDYLPVSDVSSSWLSETVRMANVFTAAADGVIDRVSCQTDTPGTHVLYEVFILDDDAADPMDGVRVATAEAVYPYGGFHKAKLDTPTLVREGQRFSVVVTQVTPDGDYSFSLQYAYNEKGWGEGSLLYGKGVINEEESFCFLEEDGWHDMSDREFQRRLMGDLLEVVDLDNFPIKAYLALPGGEEEGPAAPTADDLIYNGKAQPLLTMPEALPKGYAKARFSVDGGAHWSDAVPTATHTGAYSVLVKYVGDAGNADFCEAPIEVAILPAPLTVEARDQSIFVGAPVPEWSAESYTVTGLLGSDKLDTAPTVTYQRDGAAAEVDTSQPGAYEIVPSGAAAADYTVSYRSGKLTIDWPPSGGGGDFGPSTPAEQKQPEKQPEKQEPRKAAPVFSDVDEDTWYADAVAWAVEMGITTGTDESHFSPDLPCTRGQMLTFLWRAAGCPEPAGDTLAFTDVEPGSYYETAVRWAVEMGITTGVDETHFAPDVAISRAQTVTFLFRCFGGGAAESGTAFTDVPEEAWYAGAVAWAVEQGVTLGVDATHFAPDLDCTRAQVVTFLYRVFVQMQA